MADHSAHHGGVCCARFSSQFPKSGPLPNSQRQGTITLLHTLKYVVNSEHLNDCFIGGN